MKHLICITAIGALMTTSCATVPEQWNGDTLAQGATQSPALASSNPSSELGLVNTLVDRFGINSQQALGGVGSIFALAQQRMKPEDFMQLSSSVPGMDRYLSSVPGSTSSVSWLSSEAELMADKNNSLGSLTALTGSFQTLGMNADMISQFVPVVLQHVQTESGPTAMSLLLEALY
ncbi:MAG: DUF2780 domain-containing protein [Methylomonas sp.]